MHTGFVFGKPEEKVAVRMGRSSSRLEDSSLLKRSDVTKARCELVS
jgi:hypothetical protein